jgi:hypothetical protein
MKFISSYLASSCPLRRRGFKKSEVKILSKGEDLGEAK